MKYLDMELLYLFSFLYYILGDTFKERIFNNNMFPLSLFEFRLVLNVLKFNMKNVAFN